MRIIAGRFGGRRLISPKDHRIRPTSDKVRGSVFNMLEARDALIDATVLDAFCGSGALGLEALSRGARSCHFVDNDRDSLTIARTNAEQLDCLNLCHFVKSDSCHITFSEETYGLVFLDPPYHKGIISPLLRRLLDHSVLKSEAWVVCEAHTSEEIDISGYEIDIEKTYGTIKIMLLRIL